MLEAEVAAHRVGQHILITADLPFERLDFLSTLVGQRVGISLKALRCDANTSLMRSAATSMELADKFIQSLLPQTFLIPFNPVKTTFGLGWNTFAQFAFG